MFGKEPHSIHPEYQKYNVVSVSENDIKDNARNIEVFTETMGLSLLNNSRKTQKIMWWMSIDFYYQGKVKDICIRDLFKWNKKTCFEIFKYLLKNSCVNHRNEFDNRCSIRKIIESGCCFYYQCEYIKSFLVKLGVQDSLPLSDYINTDFYTSIQSFEKEDIVLYNPAKGLDFTSRLIKKAPDINWIPIKNLNRNELRDLISKAKLYIDFGNHPGKDRLPRECAIAGCCIITGKRGSAGFIKDVNIPETYKFDEHLSDVETIIKRIRYVLKNYYECVSDFVQYRDGILREKQNFEKEVLSIFSIGESFN